MRKSVTTLVDDIYEVLNQRDGAVLSAESLAEHGTNMVHHTFRVTQPDERGPREEKVLYASELGRKCGRQLWYKYNTPEFAEPLLPHTKFKFVYGSLIEESVLLLTKAAGHTVSHEQQRVEIDLSNGWRIKGRIDAVIDGCVVDVKSMSPYGFDSFVKEGLTDDTDKFGYRHQLWYYHVFGHFKTPIIENPAILAADKVNGHLFFQKIPCPFPASSLRDAYADLTSMLEGLAPPHRQFKAEPHNKSGNEKLGIECSYCEFKKTCWPGLRTFVSSRGPIFLTKVVKEPEMVEVP